MAHYVRLWSRLLTSSILDEAVEVRWLFITMLVAMDSDGHIHATESALARLANLNPDQIASALAVLQSPDPNSTTPDEDGRRVLLVAPNTWKVVNAERYRQLKDAETVRAETRARVAKHRDRKRKSMEPNACNASNSEVTQVDVDVEVEVEVEELPKDVCAATEVAPPILTFPTDGKPKSWDLTQEYVEELKEAFPSVDVLAECRKALAWVNADRSRKKTSAGMKRYLVGWMGRCQNRGPAPASPRRPDEPRRGRGGMLLPEA